MFCYSCGMQLPDGARFCMRCGRQINPAAAGKTPPAPQPAPQSQPVIQVNQPQGAPAQEVWRCQRCGAFNHPAAVFCIRCKTSKPIPANQPVNRTVQPVQAVTPPAQNPAPPAQRVVSRNEWRCEKCGRVNQNNVGTCGCGEMNPRGRQYAQKSTVPTQGTWSCPQCGTVNTTAATFCKSCSTHRPGAAAKPAPKPAPAPAPAPKPAPASKPAPKPAPKPEPSREPTIDEWRCEKCGKINPNSESVCDCGGYRPYQFI